MPFLFGKTREYDKGEYEQTLLLKCACGSLGHGLYLSWVAEELNDVAYLSYQIDDTYLWARIKNAFRYLFKRESIWIEDLVLDREDVEQMKEAITKFLKN